MKKITIILSVCSLLLMSGCVNRYFRYTVNINPSGTWHIDQTGDFLSATFLTATLDIPNDADILEVNIESLTLKPRVLTGHTAASVQAEGRLNGRTLFQRQTIPFSIEGVPLEFVPDQLLEPVVAQLKQEFNDFVRNRRFNSGTTFSLNGSVQGGRALMNIEYSIKATVKYGRCEEVLEVLGDVGEPCKK
ncbi:MAG: hypothetical protein HY961_03970 [Ignavibacteriae bacterium]|nr:hypothetical protein [Ignavibacteriota bacterium]